MSWLLPACSRVPEGGRAVLDAVEVTLGHRLYSPLELGTLM